MLGAYDFQITLHPDHSLLNHRGVCTGCLRSLPPSGSVRLFSGHVLRAPSGCTPPPGLLTQDPSLPVCPASPEWLQALCSPALSSQPFLCPGAGCGVLGAEPVCTGLCVEDSWEALG